MDNIKKICTSKKFFALNLFFMIASNAILVFLVLTLENIFTNAEMATISLEQIIIFFCLLVLYFVFGFLLSYFTHYAEQNAVKRLNFYLYNRILNKDYSYFEENNSGEILNKLSDLSEQVGVYFADVRVIVVGQIVSLLTLAGIIYYLNWIIGLVITFCTVSLMISSKKIATLVGKNDSNFIEANGELDNSILEVLNNISLVKNTNSKKFLLNSYKTKYEKGRFHFGIKNGLFQGIYYGIYNLLNFGLSLIVLVIGIVLHQHELTTLAVVVSIYSLVGQIQNPANIIGKIIALREMNKNNVSKILGIFDESTDDKRTYVDNLNFSKLSFQSTGLKTSEKNEILKNINFEIQKGDFVIIKGKSGVGKSTIFKMILNELTYDNEAKVEINNCDCKKYFFPRKVMVVHQNNYIFHDSIYFNLTMGDHIEDEEINEILEICCLKDFINKYGFNKTIDNLSSNISGGEKQRISLARILLKKPELLLLDEITASLDEQNSEKIVNNLYEYTKKNNITVLAISHKDEFDKYANKFISITNN